MQETLEDSTLIRIGEGILKEAMVANTKEAAEVASENICLICWTVSSSKGSHHKEVACCVLNGK